MLLLFLLQTVGPPNAPPPTHTKTIFTGDDYPREALLQRWEGTAVAELSVDAHGKVTDCQIIQSTGHRVLDYRTCVLIRKRARFIPDTDASGRPIPSKVTTPPIDWQLP